MHTPDIVVVGSGPAGSTVARLLAQWGHSVAVLSAPPTRRAFAEALPPSLRRIFDTLGLRARIDSAGFYRSTGNTVWWDRDEPRVEAFAGGERGYQVYRPAFDELLVNEAAAAGASIRLDAIVRHVTIEDADVATVSFEAAGVAQTIVSRLVLDCSGRAGVIARHGFRRPESGHATLALMAPWQSPPGGWPLPDPSHTLIEAYQNGWVWSVPVAPDSRYVAAMVDRHDADLHRGGGLDRAYRSELEKTRRIGPLVAAGSMTATPWSVDASLYSATQYAGPTFLLVGDAGSFIDPLSSFGVKKAMASAWLAAVVSNTCLINPSMRSAASCFYEERERAVYDSYLAQAARFFSDGSMRYDNDFWSDRAGPRDAPWSDGDDYLLDDPRARSAWEALRVAETVSLERSAATDIVQVPAVRGREIVFERAATGPGLPAPLRFVRGVDLVSMLDLITDGPDVPDLFDRYNRASPSVPLPDFLAALSTLLGAGLVTNRGARG